VKHVVALGIRSFTRQLQLYSELLHTPEEIQLLAISDLVAVFEATKIVFSIWLS